MIPPAAWAKEGERQVAETPAAKPYALDVADHPAKRYPLQPNTRAWVVGHRGENPKSLALRPSLATLSMIMEIPPQLEGPADCFPWTVGEAFWR
jgi:hypothetical protein